MADRATTRDDTSGRCEAAAPPAYDYDDIWQNVYGEMQDRGPVHRHMRRILRRTLARLDYRSVVEIGCGAGHNLPLICAGRKLERVTGVDVSKEALRLASRAHQGEFELLDIEQAPLPGEWDLVFCSLVLEHLPDDVAALRNMATMSRKHVVLTTIAGDFERYRAWDEQMGHVRNYAVGELERKMNDVGLTVHDAVYWGFPLYTPLARTLQNGMTSEPSYSAATRILAQVMFLAYFLNSHKRGDLLIVTASV